MRCLLWKSQAAWDALGYRKISNEDHPDVDPKNANLYPSCHQILTLLVVT